MGASHARVRVSARQVCTRAAAASSAAANGQDEAKALRTDVLQEIARVGLPILGAALSEPLLGVVDTACIGRTGSSVALAALAVTCAFYQFLSNSVAFLVTSTTNCVAASIAAKDAEATSRLVGHAVLIAGALGVAAAAAVLLWPRELMGLYGVQLTGEVMAPALSYLLTRAVSIPSIFLMYVAVGASLGARNSAAPAAGVVAAAAVNLVGDAIFVLVMKLSLFGAAAATAVASWVGSALVLGMLSKTVPWRLSVPRSLADIRPLVAVSAALLVAQVTNSVTYSFTTMVASKAGTTAAAAHQISLQIWWLLSYFPVPLYLAAQSLLAGAAGAPRRGVVGVQVLCTLGLGLAVVLSLANAGIALGFSGSFTNDPAVVAMVVAVTLPAALAQALATINTTLEGIFAGTGRLGYIAMMSLTSTTLACGGMWVAQGRGWGLESAWWGLVVFEAMRAGCHLATWPAYWKRLRASWDSGGAAAAAAAAAAGSISNS